MQGPFAVTLNVLTGTTSPDAVGLLAEGMDSSRESISLASALALLDRHGGQGLCEILRRFPQRSPAFRQTLQVQSDKFNPILRQALVQGTSEQRLEALDGVLALHAVDQIPQLVQLLTREDLPELDAVADCLRNLVSLVDEELRATSVTDASRSAVTARRDKALTHLDQALSKLDAICNKDVIVEAVLSLGPSSHPAVRKVLWQASADCRERTGRLLLTSTHPKVMQQVIDALKQSYPHPKAFEAVKSRTDVEFLCELLRSVTEKSNAMFAQNLKQVDRLAWLESAEPPFELIPQPLQPALLTLVLMTKVSDEQKALLQDWLLCHGGPAGRMAAAERAAVLDENVMQNVLIDSLDAEDEQVQAWAVTQLRQHAVPEAFAMLIQRLDSPSASVRAAVRAELSDFNLDRVLGLVDALDSATALRVGEILRKIDDQTVAKLDRELVHGIRPKRIRAAWAIVKLGFTRDLMPQLLGLSDDEDFMLRRTLAELLGSILSSEVLPTLDRLQQDAHPRVRDAAVSSIARWEQQSAERVDPLLVM